MHLIVFTFGWGTWLKEGKSFGVEQLIELCWHILAVMALFTFVTGIKTLKTQFWKVFFPIELIYFVIMSLVLFTTVPANEFKSTPGEVWFILLPLWVLLIIPLFYSHYSLGQKGKVLGT